MPATVVNPSPRPGNDLETKTPGTSGHTYCATSVSSSQSGASLRMSADTSPSALNRSGETFADLVTRLKLDYSVRRKSVRRTSGNGSTSWPNWPTPAAGTFHQGEDVERWLARREECRQRKDNGNGFGMQLGMAVRLAGTPLWPTHSKSDPEGSRTLPPGTTPTEMRPDGKKAQVGLNNAVKMWPTPRASANENRSTKPTPSQEKGKHGKYLASEVHRRWGGPTAQCVDMDTLERNSFSRETLKAMKDAGQSYQTQTTGMLNPEFVENLMGLPYNWTNISGPPDLARYSIPTKLQESPRTAPTAPTG